MQLLHSIFTDEWRVNKGLWLQINGYVLINNLIFLKQSVLKKHFQKII